MPGGHICPTTSPGALPLLYFGQVSSTFKSPTVLCVDNVLKSLTNLLHRNKMVVTGSLCHLWRGTGGSGHFAPPQSQ